MDYRVNSYYLLRNPVTGEGSYFECAEVIQHGHNTIMYGHLIPWETRINRGHFEWQGRPTVIPIPGWNHGELSLTAFRTCLAGMGADTNQGESPYGKVRLAPVPPWYDLRSAPYKVPHPEYPEEPVYAPDREIANMLGGQPFKEGDCTMCHGWGHSCQGHTPNRDGQVRYAVKLLDLYDEVLRTGRLPLEFRHEYRAHIAKVQAGVNGPSPSQGEVR